MSTIDRLDEIEARAAVTTHGPWHRNGRNEVRDPIGRYIAETGSVGVNGADEDAQFIAHARTDVPALVAALRAVLALHEREPAVGGFGHYCRICRTRAFDLIDQPGIWPCPTVAAIAEVLS